MRKKNGRKKIQSNITNINININHELNRELNLELNLESIKRVYSKNGVVSYRALGS